MLFSSLFSVAAIASTALAANSAGCNKNPTLRSGVQNINNRQYILKLPQNYDNKKPYKLIFGFHWLGGSMNDVVNGNSVQPWYGLDTLSQGSAIFVAPNGLNNGWANQGGQDIAFVDAIIKQVEADLCVDQSQRFATGFSYGAGMSYSIACSRAKQFRAVAPIAGGLISGCDGGNDPIAYLGIHGVSDNVLPISGGIDLAQRFVKNNGCRAKQIQTVPAGSGRSVRTDFEGCSQPVSFIAWDGGHTGAPFGTGNSLAPKATWDFFTALRSNSAANVISNETEAVEQTGFEEAEAAPVTEAPAAEAPASGAPAGNPWWGQANGQWKPWTA